jgi:hypothetical protein
MVERADSGSERTFNQSATNGKKEPILHDAAYHPNVCYTQYHLPSWIGGHVTVSPTAIAASNHRLR